MALEPVASSTAPRGPDIAFLCECLTRQKVEIAALDEAFLARDDLALELRPSITNSISGEANFCSQVSALRTDLDAVPYNFSIICCDRYFRACSALCGQ